MKQSMALRYSLRASCNDKDTNSKLIHQKENLRIMIHIFKAHRQNYVYQFYE